MSTKMKSKIMAKKENNTFEIENKVCFKVRLVFGDMITANFIFDINHVIILGLNSHVLS